MNTKDNAVQVSAVHQWSTNRNDVVKMVEFLFKGKTYTFDAVNSALYGNHGREHLEVGDTLYVTQRNGNTEVRDLPNAQGNDDGTESFWVEAKRAHRDDEDLFQEFVSRTLTGYEPCSVHSTHPVADCDECRRIFFGAATDLNYKAATVYDEDSGNGIFDENYFYLAEAQGENTVIEFTWMHEVDMGTLFFYTKVEGEDFYRITDDPQSDFYVKSESSRRYVRRLVTDGEITHDFEPEPEGAA